MRSQIFIVQKLEPIHF